MSKNEILIEVKLFAQYRENRFISEKRYYPQGTKAQHIINEFELEKEFPLGVLMVNYKHQETDYELKDKDIIALFPKVGGG